MHKKRALLTGMYKYRYTVYVHAMLLSDITKFTRCLKENDHDADADGCEMSRVNHKDP